jgi:hypothetical protein
MLVAVAVESRRQVDGFVLDHALVADLDPQSIEEDRWIEGIERPVRPLANPVKDRVGGG